jgi:hypothetical protein
MKVLPIESGLQISLVKSKTLNVLAEATIPTRRKRVPSRIPARQPAQFEEMDSQTAFIAYQLSLGTCLISAV